MSVTKGEPIVKQMLQNLHTGRLSPNIGSPWMESSPNVSHSAVIDDATSLPSQAKQYHVNMHNDLVLARMDWTIMMHRIMMVLVSRIDSRYDHEFERQYIRVKDLMSASGHSGSSQYDYAKEAVRRLVREPVEFETPNGSYAAKPLFDGVRYVRHQGIISAKFDEDVEEYLLKLSEQFTSWRLDQTIPLTTSYAIRHYMLGKYVERRGRKHSETFPVEDYRQRLKCEDKYNRFVDLERRVLSPSVEEVNEKTDLTLRYEVVREGRSPVAITFTAHPPDKEITSTEPKVPEEPEVDNVTRWLHEELSQEEYQEVLSRAETWAKANGYSEDSHRTFDVGVKQGLKQIYKGRKQLSDG